MRAGTVTDSLIFARSRQGLFRAAPLLAVLVILAMTTVSAMAQQSVRLGYPGSPEGMWGRLAASLADAAGKRDVKIEHYPLIALGGERLGVDLVHKGQLDLAAVSGIYLARNVPQFNILNLPLLARNIDEARAMVKGVGPQLERFANTHGLHVLAYTWIVGTFVAQGGCVLSPEHIKGARVLDGPPFFQEAFRLAGASPVPLPGAEVFAALQTGLSRTGIFSVEFILASRLHETTDCLTDPSQIAVMVLPIVLVASQQSWSRLDDKSKRALMAEADNLATRGDEEMNKMIGTAVTTYKKAGKSIRPLDGKALESWRRLAEPIYERESSKIDGGRDLLRAAIATRSRL